METSRISKVLTVLFAAVLCFGPVGLAEQAGTAFTYQGRMMDANQTADGLYDFQFELYDSDSNGNQVGSNVNVADLDVIDGYFTAELDFNDANAFRGDARWLQIGVRAGALSDPNGYTPLSPRQEVTPTPHAIYAQSSGGLTTSEDLVLISGSGNVQVGSSDEPATLHIFGERHMYDANGAEGFSTLGVFPSSFDGCSYSETAGSLYRTTKGPITLTPAEANVAIGTAGSPTNLNNFGTFRIFSTSGYGGMSPLGVYPTEFEGASYGAPEIDWDFGDEATGKMSVRFTSKNSGSNMAIVPDGPKLIVGALDKATDLSVHGPVFVHPTPVGGGAGTLGVYPTEFEGASVWSDSSVAGMCTGESQDMSLVSGTGKIGIGTTSPDYELDVNATMRVGNESGRNLLFENSDIYAMNNGVANTLELQSIWGLTADTIINRFGGNVGIGVPSPAEKLDVSGTARLRGIAELSDPNARAVLVDSTGKLWKVVSSQRYKTDIRNLDADTDAVLKLRPVRFQYKSSGQQDIGLIAEEVEKVSRDLVIYDGEGRPDAVKYDKVALYLLSVVKDQQKENEDIKNRLAAMESLVNKLSQQQEGGIK